VLCVVASLGMSAGKVAAQAAHAAVGLFRRMQDERPPWLSAWERCGEKTVVLSVPTAAEAEALATKAQALGLPGACSAGTWRAQACIHHASAPREHTTRAQASGV
jgi:PTH2 family peptidyl-tRNA hydrolase